MTAENPMQSLRLLSSLIPTRPRRRRRPAGRGVLGIMLILGATAVLLSLAVMFLPLSQPQPHLSPKSGPDSLHRVTPGFIPPFG
jgi:hypothetical protein